MARLKLKYVHSYRDRHGKIRRYLRVPGRSSIPLPGEPGSAAFTAAYAAGLGDALPPYRPVAKRAPAPAAGSLHAIVRDYLASPYFANLKPITQSTYRNELLRLSRDHGDKPIALLDRKGVLKLLGERADRPGAANQLLKMLKLVVGFAIETGVMTTDPTHRIRRFKVPGDGFIPWSEDDISKFEARHPVGTRARLALALLLYTGQRRGDVIKLGRQHVRNGALSIRQSKTGTSLEIPIHPELKAIMDASPTGQLTFLVTGYGAPFSPAGFGNWFGARCAEAGLPTGYNAHGLRKACLRRLAEAGCTTHQIMAISGHKDIEEVERYTRAAEQARLGRQAMAMIR